MKASAQNSTKAIQSSGMMLDHDLFVLGDDEVDVPRGPQARRYRCGCDGHQVPGVVSAQRCARPQLRLRRAADSAKPSG